MGVLIAANAVGTTISHRFDLCKKIARVMAAAVGLNHAWSGIDALLYDSYSNGQQLEIISFLKQL
jgi:hypothetical protein